MRFAARFVSQCLGLSLAVGTISLGTLLTGRLTAAVTSINSPAPEQYGTAELFSKVLARHHWQEAHLESLSEVRTYQVQNGKDRVLAEEVVVMKYHAPATETFASRSEKGSRFIRHHVFQRLIKHEENRVRASKDADRLITPENYTLEIVGRDRIASSDCFVVHAVPKRKETDLFDGKMWIDSQDFAIVKLAGRLAKNPSFWIKHVDFVRNYQKVDGFWLLSREEAVSAVRIYGKETLTIEYRNYAVNMPRSEAPLGNKIGNKKWLRWAKAVRVRIVSRERQGPELRSEKLRKDPRPASLEGV